MQKIGCIILAVCLLLAALPIGTYGAEPEVAGKSALLMDVATGTVLYEKNAHEKLPPASVTKVMTLLLIMEAIDSGCIGWNDMVTASEAAAAKGGSQIYLKVGETMPVTDLVKSIAVSSANDAACAMAEYIAGSEAAFVDKMNEKAAALGMQDTHFVNCTGLDDDPNAESHLTSAYDIALMSRELMLHHPKIREFTTIWMDTIRSGSFGLANTNKMVRFYPGCTGLKTGFTQKAGYCLSASAEKDGLGLIAVVMGADSSQNRFNACKQLLDYGFANYALVRPELGESYEIPVTLGVSNKITAVPAEDVKVLLDKAHKHSVTTEVVLEESLEAPVSQGQKVGTLTVKAGDQVLRQVHMVAQAGVQRLTWGQIFAGLLRRITLRGGA